MPPKRGRGRGRDRVPRGRGRSRNQPQPRSVEKHNNDDDDAEEQPQGIVDEQLKAGGESVGPQAQSLSNLERDASMDVSGAGVDLHDHDRSGGSLHHTHDAIRLSPGVVAITEHTPDNKGRQGISRPSDAKVRANQSLGMQSNPQPAGLGSGLKKSHGKTTETDVTTGDLKDQNSKVKDYKIDPSTGLSYHVIDFIAFIAHEAKARRLLGFKVHWTSEERQAAVMAQFEYNMKADPWYRWGSSVQPSTLEQSLENQAKWDKAEEENRKLIQANWETHYAQAEYLLSARLAELEISDEELYKLVDKDERSDLYQMVGRIWHMLNPEPEVKEFKFIVAGTGNPTGSFGSLQVLTLYLPEETGFDEFMSTLDEFAPFPTEISDDDRFQDGFDLSLYPIDDKQLAEELANLVPSPEFQFQPGGPSTEVGFEFSRSSAQAQPSASTSLTSSFSPTISTTNEVNPTNSFDFHATEPNAQPPTSAFRPVPPAPLIWTYRLIGEAQIEELLDQLSNPSTTPVSHSRDPRYGLVHKMKDADDYNYMRAEIKKHSTPIVLFIHEHWVELENRKRNMRRAFENGPGMDWVDENGEWFFDRDQSRGKMIRNWYKNHLPSDEESLGHEVGTRVNKPRKAKKTGSYAM